MSTSSPFPNLCLGGDVFGWTADEQLSHAVLDAAFDAGIRFIDTSDVYSAWAHDGLGGQSETIIGRWMTDRGVRDEVVLASKVGWLNLPVIGGLRPEVLHGQIDKSLGRLQTDRLDLYYAHRDDGGDLLETLETFNELIDVGKIRRYGLSNFSGERLHEALDLCEQHNLRPPSAFQPKYSLMERGFESDARDAVQRGGLAVMPYSALAAGFLTGKYRPGAQRVDSAHAPYAAGYLDDPRGPAALAALDAAAEAHAVPVASVAIAWLRAQPTVVAPISSARTVDHVGPLAASLDLELTAAELEALDIASTPAPRTTSPAHAG